MAYTLEQHTFVFSDDAAQLQIGMIHQYLSTQSYWAQHISLQTVEASIKGSCCFAVYDGAQQIGFARVITDKATFAYLADVFILPPYQGRGIGQRFMQFIMNAPYLKGLRRFMLATKDAQTLYEKFGFTALKQPERMMEIKFFETYTP